MKTFRTHDRVGIAAPLVAILALASTGAAFADQVEVSDPASQTIRESRFGVVMFDFEIVNTGVPTVEAVALGSITEKVAPLGGDTMYDVLTTGASSGCGDPLGFGASCHFKADYIVLDGDPFDTHLPKVDEGDWFAEIVVPWKATVAKPDGSFDSGTAFGVAIVQVTDDPVPEPASWALMAVGFLGAGAVLRAARRRALVASAA